MIQTVCICGAGTMGSGIGQVAAMSGFQTLLYDVDAQTLGKARSNIEKSLGEMVEKKRISLEEKQETILRIRFLTRMEDCKADFILEAIVEKLEAKLDLFHILEAQNPATTLLASNTSSLSIGAIAAGLAKPERFAGMHFFNPATLMKLVEVVRTDYSSPDNIQTFIQLARQMQKTPVLCLDAPGFIVNHVARPYYLEALRLVEQGYANMVSIDRLMEASGFRMGPFKLMDLIGNDINYAVSCSIYEALNQPARLEPSAIQKQKLERGELGRKTGRGYYDYPR
jgi:3-hydroxybutyryl-CoA dehydrogenase